MEQRWLAVKDTVLLTEDSEPVRVGSENLLRPLPRGWHFPPPLPAAGGATPPPQAAPGAGCGCRRHFAPRRCQEGGASPQHFSTSQTARGRCYQEGGTSPAVRTSVQHVARCTNRRPHGQDVINLGTHRGNNSFRILTFDKNPTTPFYDLSHYLLESPIFLSLYCKK